MALQTIYAAIRANGWDSAASGAPSTINPWQYGTVEFSSWLAGWESYHFGR